MQSYKDLAQCCQQLECASKMHQLCYRTLHVCYSAELHLAYLDMPSSSAKKRDAQSCPMLSLLLSILSLSSDSILSVEIDPPNVHVVFSHSCCQPENSQRAVTFCRLCRTSKTRSPYHSVIIETVHEHPKLSEVCP